MSKKKKTALIITCLFPLFLYFCATAALGQTDIAGGTPDIGAKVHENMFDKLITRIDTVIEEANPYASNAGVGEVISQLNDYRHSMKNLAQGLDPSGKPIPKKQLKKLMEIFKGAEKSKRMTENMKHLDDLTKQFRHLDKLTTSMNFIDPGSKVLGYLWEGDIEGGMVKLVSEGCKFVVVSGGAIVGGATAGFVFTPVATPAGAVAGAYTAEQLYDTYIGSYFDKVHQCNKYVHYRMTYIGNNLDRVLTKIADNGERRLVHSTFLRYLHGNIPLKDFKEVVHPIRDKIQEAMKEKKKKAREDKIKIVAALRKLETDNPSIKELTDQYVAGKIDLKGKLSLLKTLQQEYGEKCHKELSRQYVLHSLSRLQDNRKIAKVLAAAKITPPKKFYQDLCSYYSHPGTGFSYRPEGHGDCKGGGSKGLPCLGGNWGCSYHPYPSKMESWDRCLEQNRIFVTKENPKGIRMDEYIAGKRVIQHITGRQ